MEYLEKRQEEAKRPEKLRSRRSRSRRLDEIVNDLQSITDQAALRQALADGRQWKKELDILLATLRRLPSIDIDALREGKVSSPNSKMNGPAILAPEDSKTMRRLFARLSDNEGLAEFGLIFKSGRVKMEFAPGIDLVMPEETLLLARLAGIEPPGNAAEPA